MSLPLKWEFPGGKIDPGESPEECLRRELVEEMGICVHVGTGLAVTTHCYPTFVVTLHPFVCAIQSGEIALHEHTAATWHPPNELLALDWAKADIPVIASYLAECEAGRG